MRRLYEKKEILFAVLWIVVYCIVLGTIRGNFGDESICMLIALLVFTAGIIVFVKTNHLEGKYGLANHFSLDSMKALNIFRLCSSVLHENSGCHCTAHRKRCPGK